MFPDSVGPFFDRAVPRFPVELGRRVQERREAVDAGMTARGVPLPEGGFMSRERLASMLARLGVPISEAELALLEAGQGPLPDVRLLMALVFLLEISLDEVVVACLSGRAGSGDGAAEPQ
jgi:hypothetical protein